MVLRTSRDWEHLQNGKWYHIEGLWIIHYLKFSWCSDVPSKIVTRNRSSQAFDIKLPPELHVQIPRYQN